MTRRNFMAAIASAAASTMLPGSLFSQDKPASPRRRPNVIFIYVDDLDFQELGLYGGKVLTPHMDKLARDGMIFNRGYVASAVCTPSRYNAVTGMFASRAKNLAAVTPPGSWPKLGWNPTVTSEHTPAQMLKAAGYRTGMVGKWHLGTDEPLEKLPAGATSADPEVHRIVKANNAKAVAAVKKAGYDYADAIYSMNVQGAPLPADWVIHNQEWVTARALEFVEQSKDHPFFLYYATNIPHSPYGLKSLESDPRITMAGLLDKPLDVQPSRQDVLRRTRAAGVDDKMAFQTWLDDGIGVLLKKLDDLGLTNDTLILYVSDNANLSKYTCYEGGAHVPFFARWPGHIKPGSKSDALVCNLDVPATALDLAGVTPPKDATLDGRSLLPLLEGRKTDWRDNLMLEITYTRAIVTDGWKYVAVRFPPEIQKKIDAGEIVNPNQEGTSGRSHYDTEDKHPGYADRDQLYDLKADPGEKRNLAADPKYKDKLLEMQGHLKRQSARLSMPFGEFKQ